MSAGTHDAAGAGAAGIATLRAIPPGQRSGRTATVVRHVIEEAILEGRVDPGSHLNAGALAQQLGVSHIPVREALRSLEAEGWVELRPHLGAYVRPRTEHELADLFELRVTVEPEAARLAADRRTTAQLDRLEVVVDTQAAVSDAARLARLNADFHVAVAECSHNAWLVTVLRAMSSRTRFYFGTVAPARHDDSVREHRGIIEALGRRDGEGAATLMRAHIAQTRADVVAAVRDLT